MNPNTSPTVTLTVAVVDTAGTPIPNATIELGGRTSSAHGAPHLVDLPTAIETTADFSVHNASSAPAGPVHPTRLA